MYDNYLQKYQFLTTEITFLKFVPVVSIHKCMGRKLRNSFFALLDNLECVVPWIDSVKSGFHRRRHWAAHQSCWQGRCAAPTTRTLELWHPLFWAGDCGNRSTSARIITSYAHHALNMQKNLNEGRHHGGKTQRTLFLVDDHAFAFVESCHQCAGDNNDKGAPANDTRFRIRCWIRRVRVRNITCENWPWHNRAVESHLPAMCVEIQLKTFALNVMLDLGVVGNNTAPRNYFLFIAQIELKTLLHSSNNIGFEISNNWKQYDHLKRMQAV